MERPSVDGFRGGTGLPRVSTFYARRPALGRSHPNIRAARTGHRDNSPPHPLHDRSWIALRAMDVGAQDRLLLRGRVRHVLLLRASSKPAGRAARSEMGFSAGDPAIPRYPCSRPQSRGSRVGIYGNRFTAHHHRYAGIGPGPFVPHLLSPTFCDRRYSFLQRVSGTHANYRAILAASGNGSVAGTWNDRREDWLPAPARSRRADGIRSMAIRRGARKEGPTKQTVFSPERSAPPIDSGRKTAVSTHLSTTSGVLQP